MPPSLAWSLAWSLALVVAAIACAVAAVRALWRPSARPSAGAGSAPRPGGVRGGVRVGRFVVDVTVDAGDAGAVHVAPRTRAGLLVALGAGPDVLAVVAVTPLGLRFVARGAARVDLARGAVERRLDGAGAGVVPLQAGDVVTLAAAATVVRLTVHERALGRGRRGA